MGTVTTRSDTQPATTDPPGIVERIEALEIALTDLASDVGLHAGVSLWRRRPFLRAFVTGQNAQRTDAEG